jgi:hypothetical protein
MYCAFGRRVARAARFVFLAYVSMLLPFRSP